MKVRKDTVRQEAFTLVEVLVVIGLIAALMAILLPAMERARHRAYIQACASNLHQLGQALEIYSDENHGVYPRTFYVAGAVPVAGTGVMDTSPFGPGVMANDVTAPLWLLARSQKLPTRLFLCPYDDVNEFEADKGSLENQGNFTDYKKNLGYSYANPYPNQAALAAGYRLVVKVRSEFAVMADLNPGVSPARKADPFLPVVGSSNSEMAYGNSGNHEREGQNVLFGDGHVTYELTALCGIAHDNIYTAQNAVRPTIMTSPATATDAVLLPAD